MLEEYLKDNYYPRFHILNYDCSREMHINLTKSVEHKMKVKSTRCAGAQFEGDLGEILALGAEISPYIGLREKWESP